MTRLLLEFPMGTIRRKVYWAIIQVFWPLGEPQASPYELCVDLLVR
jgi:hypothetical protein